MTREKAISAAYLERLRPKVRTLLRRHWRKVEAVAEALLISKRRSGPEIDAIVLKVTTRRERQIAERIELFRETMYRELCVPKTSSELMM